jgi:hypothetical protein
MSRLADRDGAVRGVALLGALACLLAAAIASAAAAETIQKDNIVVSPTAKMRPRALPRTGTAPISISVSGQISTADESLPPQLKELQIEINRHGRFDFAGLPVCKIGQIQPASDSRALAACRSSLVGQGRFVGTFALSGATPYPISGRLLLFNGREGRHPVLLGHIYSSKPFATSFVIVFKLLAKRHGNYGTTLTADIAKALGNERNLTSIEMTLSRRWRSGGARHSYLSASCPAPKGFGAVPFPLARTTFSFAGGTKLNSVLTSSCRAR